MKSSELRDLTLDNLQSRLNDAQEELMKLRFQQATGELTNTARVRELRRNIARMMTILNESKQAGAGKEGDK